MDIGGHEWAYHCEGMYCFARILFENHDRSVRDETDVVRWHDGAESEVVAITSNPNT